jgi:hypothetical protein
MPNNLECLTITKECLPIAKYGWKCFFAGVKKVKTFVKRVLAHQVSVETSSSRGGATPLELSPAPAVCLAGSPAVGATPFPLKNTPPNPFFTPTPPPTVPSEPLTVSTELLTVPSESRMVPAELLTVPLGLRMVPSESRMVSSEWPMVPFFQLGKRTLNAVAPSGRWFIRPLPSKTRFCRPFARCPFSC